MLQTSEWAIKAIERANRENPSIGNSISASFVNACAKLLDVERAKTDSSSDESGIKKEQEGA